eukprot:1387512-Pyramimonas_sp.AAC.1
MLKSKERHSGTIQDRHDATVTGVLPAASWLFTGPPPPPPPPPLPPPPPPLYPPASAPSRAYGRMKRE